MPNTTYIKALIAALVFASPVQAQAAPPQGCYERDYTAAHLAKQPKQVVDQIRLNFHRAGEDDLNAYLSVLTANQGHVRKSGHGGQRFEQFLICFADSTARTGWRCAVECDGGSMEITRNDGKILEFRTRYLLLGDSEACGGPVDLAEVQDKPVTYRLHRVPAAKCGAE